MPVRSITALLRPTAALAAVALVLTVSACQDPSGVGLGLIGENGNTPTGTVIAADSVRLLAADLVAVGGYGGGVSSSRNQARMIVGHADDPLVGNVTAAAYFDLVPPTSIPNGYREQDITDVALIFKPDYIYGDSTATLTLELRGVSNSWIPTALTPDTSLAVGPLIATYTVAAADTLVTLPLPSSWVIANADLIQDVDFAEDFDGFRLSVAEGTTTSAVLGFSTANVADRSGFMRVTTDEDDEVDYPIGETYSSVTWETEPSSPANRTILRSADDQTLSFSFNYDDLGDVAVAGGAVRFNIDRAALQSPGFARPLPPGILLYGISNNADSTRTLITSANIPATGDVISFTSAALTAIAQQASLGTRTFARFELSLGAAPINIGSLPIITGPAPANPVDDTRPRLTLTLIPTAP